MYSDVPAGQIGLAQMWSGDIINAHWYLPEGTSPEILQYWFPPDGKGLVDNDLMVMLRSGKNPVLAHLFINHMLDPEVASRTSRRSATSRRRTRSTPTRWLPADSSRRT